MDAETIVNLPSSSEAELNGPRKMDSINEGREPPASKATYTLPTAETTLTNSLTLQPDTTERPCEERIKELRKNVLDIKNIGEGGGGGESVNSAPKKTEDFPPNQNPIQTQEPDTINDGSEEGSNSASDQKSNSERALALTQKVSFANKVIVASINSSNDKHEVRPGSAPKRSASSGNAYPSKLYSSNSSKEVVYTSSTSKPNSKSGSASSRRLSRSYDDGPVQENQNQDPPTSGRYTPEAKSALMEALIIEKERRYSIEGSMRGSVKDSTRGSISGLSTRTGGGEKLTILMYPKKSVVFAAPSSQSNLSRRTSITTQKKTEGTRRSNSVITNNSKSSWSVKRIDPLVNQSRSMGNVRQSRDSFSYTPTKNTVEFQEKNNNQNDGIHKHVLQNEDLVDSSRVSRPSSNRYDRKNSIAYNDSEKVNRVVAAGEFEEGNVETNSDYYDYLLLCQRHASQNFIIKMESSELVYANATPTVKIIGPYILGGKIGKGSFGKVKEGLCSETLRRVAVKIINKKRLRKIQNGVENVLRYSIYWLNINCEFQIDALN